MDEGMKNKDEDVETWTTTWKRGRRQGNMDEDMETWTSTYSDMVEDVETQTRTWKHGRGQESETENGSPCDFPQSVYRLLIIQTEVCRLSVFHKEVKVIRLQTD